MCSLNLTHPRGAVGGSVPCSRVSPQSLTLPARARIRTHNLGLPRVSSPTLYPLGHDCPSNTIHILEAYYSVLHVMDIIIIFQYKWKCFLSFIKVCLFCCFFWMQIRFFFQPLFQSSVSHGLSES